MLQLGDTGCIFRNKKRRMLKLADIKNFWLRDMPIILDHLMNPRPQSPSPPPHSCDRARDRATSRTC